MTAIVKRCLAKIPLARYVDALTLRDELMSALQQVTQPRLRRVAAPSRAGPPRYAR